jgi:hypothetical protein
MYNRYNLADDGNESKVKCSTVIEMTLNKSYSSSKREPPARQPRKHAIVFTISNSAKWPSIVWGSILYHCLSKQKNQGLPTGPSHHKEIHHCIAT